MWQGYIRSFKLICCMVLLLPAITLAAGKDKKDTFIVEGQDYIKLPETVRANPLVAQLFKANPNKVQVIFFFSYGCHGCELFHAPFSKWEAEQAKKFKGKVAIYTFPVAFNQQWAMLSRLYYVEEALQPDGKLSADIFKAILKQGLKLWDVDVMRKYFVQHGFAAVEFDQAYNSFIVNRQVQRADQISKAFAVSATPDIIVNGPTNSYKIDVAKAGKNIQRVIDILNYLVAREAKLL